MLLDQSLLVLYHLGKLLLRELAEEFFVEHWHVLLLCKLLDELLLIYSSTARIPALLLCSRRMGNGVELMLLDSSLG